MFVDVIHSNGENLILGGLGSWQPMGHVDFYPNGGRMQTGCSNLFVGAVTDIIWSSANEGRSLCNHRRAYKFFTDSVSPKCHFPSFPCETYDDFLAVSTLIEILFLEKQNIEEEWSKRTQKKKSHQPIPFIMFGFVTVLFYILSRNMCWTLQSVYWSLIPNHNRPSRHDTSINGNPRC